MFDLDGTLVDSREGVTRCIQQALVDAGIEPPPSEALTKCIGPPLPISFAMLLRTTDTRQVERAIAVYRRRFEEVGMFESRLYPGIADMLAELQSIGHIMCVVTAKPHVYARQILEHFGIARLFHGVYGPEPDARAYTKASLIREACVAAGRSERTIMIGDRAEDVEGAKSNGLGCVAVAWGYGAREELETARPDHIVASSGELVDYLRDTA